MSKVTTAKNCYCHTCAKSFHYLGIANHRLAHKRRGERCLITYTDGKTFDHKPEPKP